MIDIHFIILNAIAFFLLFFSIEYEGLQKYWNGIMAFMSSIVFLVLTFGGMTLETPYSGFNVTSGFIQTGYQMYVMDYWLIFVYLMFFVGVFFYFIWLIFGKMIIEMVYKNK